jgi:hypothetical protein
VAGYRRFPPKKKHSESRQKPRRIGGGKHAEMVVDNLWVCMRMRMIELQVRLD